MNDEGVRLPGGNVGGAWRVGDTVRRPTGPWTPAVHALLDHLAGRLDGVPRVHGVDDRGREILDYLPGEVPTDADQVTPARLASLVDWTRRFHDAGRGFDHPGPWRMPAPDGPPDIIGHNDIAYYNVCFDGDQVVGVFDWDVAGPTTRLLELAFLAWNGVPLWRDIGVAAAVERLHIIADRYGTFSVARILQAVPARIRASIALIEARGPGMENLAAVGEPDRTRAALSDFERRRPALLGALSSAR